MEMRKNGIYTLELFKVKDVRCVRTFVEGWLETVGCMYISISGMITEGVAMASQLRLSRGFF